MVLLLVFIYKRKHCLLYASIHSSKRYCYIYKSKLHNFCKLHVNKLAYMSLHTVSVQRLTDTREYKDVHVHLTCIYKVEKAFENLFHTE